MAKKQPATLDKTIRLAFGGIRLINGNERACTYDAPNFATCSYFTPGGAFKTMAIGAMYDVPHNGEGSYRFTNAVRVEGDDDDRYAPDNLVEGWRTEHAAALALVRELRLFKSIENLENLTLAQICVKLRYLDGQKRNALIRQVMMIVMGARK